MNRAPWYRTQPARIALRMLGYAVLFAIVGVLIGGPLAFFALVGPKAWEAGRNMDKLIGAVPYAWLGGCLFGLVPAAVTGAVAGWWRPRLHHWRFRWALVAVGTASTVLWAAYYYFNSPRDRSSILGLLPTGVATAAVLTLALATLIGRRNLRASAPTPH